MDTRTLVMALLISGLMRGASAADSPDAPAPAGRVVSGRAAVAMIDKSDGLMIRNQRRNPDGLDNSDSRSAMNVACDDSSSALAVTFAPQNFAMSAGRSQISMKIDGGPFVLLAANVFGDEGHNLVRLTGSRPLERKLEQAKSISVRFFGLNETVHDSVFKMNDDVHSAVYENVCEAGLQARSLAKFNRPSLSPLGFGTPSPN
jgi:hypothetical protein